MCLYLPVNYDITRIINQFFPFVVSQVNLCYKNREKVEKSSEKSIMAEQTEPIFQKRVQTICRGQIMMDGWCSSETFVRCSFIGNLLLWHICECAVITDKERESQVRV
jgi:hypothetical protein